MSLRTIYGNFDLKGFDDTESNFYTNPSTKSVLNNISETITFDITNDELPIEKLVFSTNGVDGIGYNDTSFELNEIYYKGQKIYFVIRGKTENDFPVKTAPNFYLTDDSTNLYGISLSCVDANNNQIPINVVDKFDGIVEQGVYKGYFTVDNVYDNVKLIATMQTPISSVSGESSVFNIYPAEGKYSIRKINEDHDQKQTYKDLIFQNILIDKPNFFDKFLGQIVGDGETSSEDLGTLIYEKISNFSMNETDISTSNIDQFQSSLDMLGVTYNKLDSSLPPSIRRICDIGSLNLSKIHSSENAYQYNFDSKGFENSSTFGTNLGDKLPILTTTLYTGVSGKPIVAYEKFSEKYKVIYPVHPQTFDLRYSDEGTGAFPLSAYSKYWGWNLILPNVFNTTHNFQLQSYTNDNIDVLALEDGGRLVHQTYDDAQQPERIDDFYEFYEFNDTIDGTFINEFVDFNNPSTQLSNLSSISQFADDGGIIDELLLNIILTRTQLLTS
jgi:hypothetical protein